MKFCLNCREERNGVIKESETTTTVRGYEITFIEKSAYCEICNEEIYIGKVMDENLDRIHVELVKVVPGMKFNPNRNGN